MARVGGIIRLKVNGETFKAKGNFSYNLGVPKREEVINMSGEIDYKEMPQAPFIEGEITDYKDLDKKTLLQTSGADVTLELSVGKTVVLRDAFYAADGKGETEEGNIEFKMIGASAEEI